MARNESLFEKIGIRHQLVSLAQCFKEDEEALSMLRKLTGMSVWELINKLKKGWTLTPPKEDG